MTLHYSFELPTTKVEAAAEFVTAEAIAEIANAAESCGYGAVHVTDHPAPDAKWLDHGGHHALDPPFVALSFAAARTSTIRLLTNIYVAAYRNPPFLGAKLIQSLDMLSGRRLILGTGGAGYLKPEYRSLGVDFETRGALLDEALDVLAKIYTGDDVAYDGSRFSARGVRFRPPFLPEVTAAGLDRRQQQDRRTPRGVTIRGLGTVQHCRLRGRFADGGNRNCRRTEVGDRLGPRLRRQHRADTTAGHLLFGVGNA